MQDFYTSATQLGSFREKSNESTRSKIPQQRNSMPYCMGETEARERAKPFGKHKKQNHPEFPEFNHEIPDGRIYNSPSGTKYLYYDNQPHTTNINKMSTKCVRHTGTDYNGTGSEEENIPEEFTKYRSNRDVFYSETSSSSDSSESDRPWEERRKDRGNKASFKSKAPKQTGKGFATGETKTKNEKTQIPTTYVQEEFSDHHQTCPKRHRSRNESLPQINQQPEMHPNVTQYENHQKQSYNEFYDRSHDSISRHIPRDYKSPALTYPAYGNQLYAENTNDLVTKYTDSTDTDEDAKQTEQQIHRRRRKVLNNSEVAFINSGSSGQQQASKGTVPCITFRNKSEKNRNQHNRRQMNQIDENLYSDKEGVYLNRESKYSDNTQLYASAKCACSGETENDDRQTEQETYEEPKTFDRRRNLDSSEVLFFSGRWREQTTKATGFKNNSPNKTENHHIRSGTEVVNQLGDGQNAYSQEDSSDYSDECTRKRNETFPNTRRQFRVGEDSRRQYSSKEVEPNEIFRPKSDKDFSEVVCGARSTHTECENQRRIQSSRRKAERAIERNGPEAERWGGLESGQEVSMSGRRHIPYWQRGYQVRAEEMSQDCECQQKNFTDRVSCRGSGTYNETAYMHDNLGSLRVNSSCAAGENDVTETNPYRAHGHGDSDGYIEKKLCERNTYRKENLCRGCNPALSCGDYSHNANSFHEITNSVRKSAPISASGKEKIYKNAYEAYDSMLYPEEHEDFSLQRRSNDCRSEHESNICAVQNTVIADLGYFGSKLKEAIVSCHVSLQLFRATYEEWIKTRNETLRISRALEAEIRHDGNWQSGFSGFCEFLKTAGKVTEQALLMTPYAGIAIPVVRVVPSVIKKLGDVIMGSGKEKKKDVKCAAMFQVLQADIEESSLLKMFALQCEMQFKETERLLIEFMDSLLTEQMADCVEDMGLLNFLIDLSDADPSSNSFLRRISDAYRKFYNTGKGESATWETFCDFIDRDPSILDTLQNIDWHFTRSFQNQRDENDLHMCWTTISGLACSSNPKKVEDALSRVATIIRILETQQNYVIANVSKLF